MVKRGGVSIRQQIETSYLFESLVEPGRLVESRYPAAPARLKLVMLADDYIREGEHLSVEEIFWHEYFHINWSPELAPFDSDKHEWSTHGVLDHQDEHRADLFAAGVMIDQIDADDTADSIADRCEISLRLASLALRIERRKKLFSREWRPVYA
jgi:hypothetical protein